MSCIKEWKKKLASGEKLLCFNNVNIPKCIFKPYNRNKYSQWRNVSNVIPQADILLFWYCTITEFSASNNPAFQTESLLLHTAVCYFYLVVLLSPLHTQMFVDVSCVELARDKWSEIITMLTIICYVTKQLPVKLLRKSKAEQHRTKRNRSEHNRILSARTNRYQISLSNAILQNSMFCCTVAEYGC